MLVVIGVLAALFAAASMGARKSWESQEIKSSAMRLAHDITLASHEAVKRNTTVELRFYRFFDRALASDKPFYRGYQLLSRDAAGVATPMFELERFDGTTVMSAFGRFSSIMPPTGMAPKPETDPELGVGPYQFVSVQFRPDGSTNLDPAAKEPWTITLIPMNWAERTGETPKLYQTLSIEPRTGGVRVW